MAEEKDKISLEKDSTEKNLADTHPNEARFDVKSLDEVRDENGNGIFHLRTKTKWIIAFSVLILICAGGLIYAAMEYMLVVENWQLAIWIMCTVIALYSIMAVGKFAVQRGFIFRRIADTCLADCLFNVSPGS